MSPNPPPKPPPKGAGKPPPKAASKPAAPGGAVLPPAGHAQQPTVAPKPGPANPAKPSAAKPTAPSAAAPVKKAPLAKPAAPKAPTRSGPPRVGASSGPPKNATKPGVPAVDPNTLIETQALIATGLEKLKVPPAFHEFIEQIAPRVALPETSRQILESFANIDVTAEKISQVLKGNPYYEALFFRVFETMGKRENTPSIEAALILMGMQNSRNLIVGLQLARTVQRTHPSFSKEGKLMANPQDLLKYALKTEEALAGNKSGYADTAYSAGLLFDLFGLIINEIGADKKKALAYLDTLYAHGLKTAQVAIEVGKALPDFGFKKFLFAAGLIHDIGKAALAAQHADYPDFLDECSKKMLPRQVRHYAEQKRYGVDHALLGALICREFKVFAQFERAVLFHHAPYLLKTKNRQLFDLACAVCLATNMASQFKRPEKADDPVIASWKGLELKDFRLDGKQIFNVAVAAARNM